MLYNYAGGFYDEVQTISSPHASTDRKNAILKMREKLKELTNISNSIAHPILLKRLTILKHDLVSLLDQIKFSPDMQVSNSTMLLSICLQNLSC
jgi:hypothetical protein